jgi:hypothetical protein
MLKHLNEHYNPSYFLSALGSGGIVVTFFLYLNFMVPHKGIPMVTFDHIYPLILKFDIVSLFILFAYLGIAFFTFKHITLLIWNLKEYYLFKKTSAFKDLKSSNKEISLMTIPLTLAMSVNVLFIVAALFIPKLWIIIEFLFPLAVIAFGAIAIYAIKIFGEYGIRVINNGDLDFINSANLSQMISVFAFAMLAVGFAAPGAMSHSIVTSAVGIFLSIAFLSMALILGFLKLIFGFQAIILKGIDKEAVPSLWIIIPIITLIGITLFRDTMGIAHNFDMASQGVASSTHFFYMSFALSLELLVGALGYVIMKREKYFLEYINGDKKSVGSFALICPGVALFVFSMFFLNFAIVGNNLTEQFSITYFILLLPILYLQFKTIQTFFKLEKKLLK